MQNMGTTEFFISKFFDPSVKILFTQLAKHFSFFTYSDSKIPKTIIYVQKKIDPVVLRYNHQSKKK